MKKKISQIDLIQKFSGEKKLKIAEGTFRLGQQLLGKKEFKRRLKLLWS